MSKEKLPEIIEVQLNYVLDLIYDAGYNGNPRPGHKIERLKSIILAELNKRREQKEEG